MRDLHTISQTTAACGRKHRGNLDSQDYREILKNWTSRKLGDSREILIVLTDADSDVDADVDRDVATDAFDYAGADIGADFLC